jgi:hypothetical protein
MTHPNLDALLQGAIDNTLTPEEQARLAGMIHDSREARDRAAEFEQLTNLIESLGPIDAPPGLVDNVLAEISHRPYAVRPSTFERGVSVNKKILFGLAIAAAIVLAVITYNTYPPATAGTEATIGAAQRAQAPQIAAQDVKLGDTSAQDVLQTETFDAIMKDDAVRTMLQDAEFRSKMQNVEMKKTLQDDAILRALKDPGLARLLKDPNFNGALNNPDMVYKFSNTNARVLLTNKVFADALRNDHFRDLLSRNASAAALAGAAFQSALKDKGFDAAMTSSQFAAQLARQ